MYVLKAISTSSIFVSIAMHNDNLILRRIAQNKCSWQEMRKDESSVYLCIHVIVVVTRKHNINISCYVMLCCAMLYRCSTQVFDCSHSFIRYMSQSSWLTTCSPSFSSPPNSTIPRGCTNSIRERHIYRPRYRELVTQSLCKAVVTSVLQYRANDSGEGDIFNVCGLGTVRWQATGVEPATHNSWLRALRFTIQHRQRRVKWRIQIQTWWKRESSGQLVITYSRPLIDIYQWWWSGVVVAPARWSWPSLVLINEVNLRRARLVLWWVTVSGFNCRCATFISLCNQPSRSTQPGHPFVDRRNEYSQRVMMPCGWGVKAGMVRVWVADKTVWYPGYIRIIYERFRNRHYNALHKFIFFYTVLKYGK